MNITMFSVYDSKAAAYLQPLFASNQAVGIRMFSTAANDEEHEFNRHAGDFTLFEIGTFECDSGVFTPHKAHLSLGTALEQIFEMKPEVVEVPQNKLRALGSVHGFSDEEKREVMRISDPDEAMLRIEQIRATKP